MFPLKATIHVGKYTIHGWYVHNWNILHSYPLFTGLLTPVSPYLQSSVDFRARSLQGSTSQWLWWKLIRCVVRSVDATHWSPVFALTLQKTHHLWSNPWYRELWIMMFSHVGIPMDPLLWKRIPTYHITLSNMSFSMSALDFVCCSQLPSGVLLASPAAVAFGAGDMYRTSFPGRGKMMFLLMSLGKGRSFGKVWFGKQRQWCFECEVYGWNGVAASVCVAKCMFCRVPHMTISFLRYGSIHSAGVNDVFVHIIRVYIGQFQPSEDLTVLLNFLLKPSMRGPDCVK